MRVAAWRDQLSPPYRRPCSMGLHIPLNGLAFVAAFIAVFHAGVNPGFVALQRGNLSYQLAQQLVLAFVLLVLLSLGVSFFWQIIIEHEGLFLCLLRHPD